MSLNDRERFDSFAQAITKAKGGKGCSFIREVRDRAGKLVTFEVKTPRPRRSKKVLGVKQ